MRKRSERIYYELSPYSVLPLKCRQKTRLGKLTYLAHFLMKIYYDYASLRSYSYKYALRNKMIRNKSKRMSYPRKHNILDAAYNGIDTAKSVRNTDMDMGIASDIHNYDDESAQYNESAKSVKKSANSDSISSKYDKSAKYENRSAKSDKAAKSVNKSYNSDKISSKSDKSAKYDNRSAKSDKSAKSGNRSAKSSKSDRSAKSSDSETVESLMSGLNMLLTQAKASKAEKPARSAKFLKYDNLAARSAASVSANFARSAFLTNRSNRVYQSGIHYKKHRSLGRIHNFSISKEDIKPFNLMSFLGVKKQSWHESQLEKAALKDMGRKEAKAY